MSEYSNSLVKPNNRYNTLSTYNSRPPGTVQGPPPPPNTPSMNVQVVLKPPQSKKYNALTYQSNGSGYYTISTGQYDRTCSINEPRSCSNIKSKIKSNIKSNIKSKIKSTSQWGSCEMVSTPIPGCQKNICKTGFGGLVPTMLADPKVCVSTEPGCCTWSGKKPPVSGITEVKSYKGECLGNGPSWTSDNWDSDYCIGGEYEEYGNIQLTNPEGDTWYMQAGDECWGNGTPHWDSKYCYGGKDESTGALNAGGNSGDYRFENDGECMGDGTSSNDWSASFCEPTEDKGKIILTSKP